MINIESRYMCVFVSFFVNSCICVLFVNSCVTLGVPNVQHIGSVSLYINIQPDCASDITPSQSCLTRLVSV